MFVAIAIAPPIYYLSSGNLREKRASIRYYAVGAKRHCRGFSCEWYSLLLHNVTAFVSPENGVRKV